jgi:hypothetical protein
MIAMRFPATSTGEGRLIPPVPARVSASVWISSRVLQQTIPASVSGCEIDVADADAGSRKRSDVRGMRAKARSATTSVFTPDVSANMHDEFSIDPVEADE